MTSLELMFDRKSHLYRGGEQISGRVVLRCDSTGTYPPVEVSYRWHTHGKGTRDKGSEIRLAMTDGKFFVRAGEIREFHFHFEAPLEPLTYHGHLVSVDWTAAAHLGHLQAEEDFLVLPGEVFEQDNAVKIERARDQVPGGWATQLSSSFGHVEEGPDEFVPRKPPVSIIDILEIAWWLSLIGACWLVGSSPAAWNWWMPYLAVMLILGGSVYAIKKYAYKTKLKVGEVWVRPDTVQRGNHIVCHADFLAKREVHLQEIRATLLCQEAATRQQGTTTVTEKCTLGEKNIARPFDEHLLVGRPISFECSFPIGPNAPLSFHSTNNAVAWTVQLQVNLGRWPGMTRELPFTVLP